VRPPTCRRAAVETSRSPPSRRPIDIPWLRDDDLIGSHAGAFAGKRSISSPNTIMPAVHAAVGAWHDSGTRCRRRLQLVWCCLIDPEPAVLCRDLTGEPFVVTVLRLWLAIRRTNFS